MRRKIGDKETFVISKVNITGETRYIVRDEDYVYVPYIFREYGTWKNDGVYLAIPLKEIERIESEDNE